MIDSYDATRLAARPRRPRAGGTMIDSYDATRLAARPRRPRAGGTMIDGYGEPLAQRAPPRHTTTVVGRRPFAMSNPDPIYVSANCRAAYQLQCDRVAAPGATPTVADNHASHRHGAGGDEKRAL